MTGHGKGHGVESRYSCYWCFFSVTCEESLRSSCTNHLTLAHSRSSMNNRMKKCTLPFVRYASQTSTKNNAAKQQSTAKRNAGCNEDPGFKTKAKNPAGADSHSVVAIIDICASCLSTSTKQTLRAKHKYVQTRQERNIIILHRAHLASLAARNPRQHPTELLESTNYIKTSLGR